MSKAIMCCHRLPACCVLSSAIPAGELPAADSAGNPMDCPGDLGEVEIVSIEGLASGETATVEIFEDGINRNEIKKKKKRKKIKKYLPEMQKALQDKILKKLKKYELYEDVKVAAEDKPETDLVIKGEFTKMNPGGRALGCSVRFRDFR